MKRHKWNLEKNCSLSTPSFVYHSIEKQCMYSNDIFWNIKRGFPQKQLKHGSNLFFSFDDGRTCRFLKTLKFSLSLVSCAWVIHWHSTAASLLKRFIRFFSSTVRGIQAPKGSRKIRRKYARCIVCRYSIVTNRTLTISQIRHWKDGSAQWTGSVLYFGQ